jgi:hypothetical protein
MKIRQKLEAARRLFKERSWSAFGAQITCGDAAGAKRKSTASGSLRINSRVPRAKKCARKSIVSPASL